VNGAGPIRQIRVSAAAAAFVWTMAAVAAFLWTSALGHRSVVALAVAQARASVRKDIAYRTWAWEHGGVYVPASLETPPNPYLRVAEREDTTPSGRVLTLVNPAYMMRQVMEADRERGGPRGRITSARPLRPENRPDAWEAEALAKMERGAVEVVEQVEKDAPVLRYMGRLSSEERCLRCHGAKGEAAGVRGGISISVPMAPYFAVADDQAFRLGTVIGLIWAVGLAAIGFGTARGCRRVRERQREHDARRALEEELAHARRLEAIGRLAGGIAHDLNNLLSPILGNSSLALERVPPGGELRQDLEDIQEAAQRARALTQRLLAFGRKQVLAVEPLDASAVVEELVPMLRRLVPHGLEVKTELERGLPPVRADRAQLEAVMLNLAANARDAMGGGGVVRLSTALEVVEGERAARAGVSPGRYVAVAVTDTGSGIDPAHMARLFEPFFTTKPTGTGLGLASAHGTVRQLGGTIDVATSLGGGSTFRVLLPVAGSDEVVAPRPRRVPERPRGGSETVLLVEDEPAVRRYVSAALASAGYRVLAAPDADEALRIAERHPSAIDALVSDLRMPRVGGRELHARLVASRPGLPTVFITGYSGDSAGAEHPMPEGTVVVQKPFTPGDLAQAVRRVLDARARA